MVINELKVQNVKRVKFVQLKLSGSNVKLEGKNKAGKTSVLDSIQMLFAGGREIPNAPINFDAGENDKAEIIATLSPDDTGQTFTIRRHWTREDDQIRTYIKVTNQDGMSPQSTQKWLDALVGHISFDPMGFMSAKAEERSQIVKSLAGLNFDDLDEQYQKLYDQRTEIGRDVKNLTGQIDQYKNLAPFRDNLRSIADVQAERDKLNDQNLKIKGAGNKISEYNEHIMNLEKGIHDYEDEIKALTDKISVYRKQIEHIHSEINEQRTLSEQPLNDITKLDAELELINSQASLVSQHNMKAQIKSELEKASKKHDLLDVQLKGIKAKKADRIAGSKMPIEGLSFQENRLQYNGVDLEQASQAEQVMVTMAIAMSMNPKLRVILIRDGSLLDSDSMDYILKLAEKNDFQVWIERVASEPSGDDSSFYIEDGGMRVVESVSGRCDKTADMFEK